MAFTLNATSIAVLLVLFGLLGYFGLFDPLGIQPDQQLSAFDNQNGDAADILQSNQGESATLYFKSYSGIWSGASTKTEVYPSYTVIDSSGATLVSDATANSTSLGMTVGKTISVYGTGATYYVDPVTNYKITNAAPVVTTKSYPIVSTTDLVIKGYDSTGTTALTADDDTNNTADYNGGSLGADETEAYYFTIESAINDKVFRLGAICTYYCGDEIDNYELVSSAWNEVNVPNGVMTDSFSMYDDTNASTSCSYKRCYEPSGSEYITINEWSIYPDGSKLKFMLETDSSTGPTANGDSYFGHVYLDYACEIAGSGDVECGWYKQDADNDPGDIGLDENPESAGYNGLDVGGGVEPQ